MESAHAGASVSIFSVQSISVSPLHAAHVFSSVGQQSHMASLFQRDAQAALMFRARPGFAAGFDLPPIRDVAFQKATGVLIIDLAHMVVAKLANLAASAALAAPASLAARRSFRSFLHQRSPYSPVMWGLGKLVRVKERVIIVGGRAGPGGARARGIIAGGAGLFRVEHFHIARDHIDRDAL